MKDVIRELSYKKESTWKDTDEDNALCSICNKRTNL